MLDKVLGIALQTWLNNQARRVRSASPPSGNLQVHAMGGDADRVLLVLDRPSVGDGFLSQELGLAGHLARQLSVLTGRGTDIDIVSQGNLTARACAKALADLDLGRFDVIVLMLGSSEALSFTRPRKWSASLQELLTELALRIPHRPQVVLVEIPPTRALIDFPHVFARPVDRRAARLNDATRAASAERAQVTVIPFPLPTAARDGRNSSEAFARWAHLIAPPICTLLDLADGAPRPDDYADERERQRALENLHVIDSAPDLNIDHIVHAARDLFGATDAALTFLENDRRWVKSATGSEIRNSSRVKSLCDLAIEHAGVFVIEDLVASRLADRHPGGSVETGFYAGFPIEAPDGRRVGVLCIIDTQPRSFDTGDRSRLRELALQLQAEVWRPR